MGVMLVRQIMSISDKSTDHIFYKLGNSLKTSYLSFRWSKENVNIWNFGMIFFVFKICVILEILVKILRYVWGVMLI